MEDILLVKEDLYEDMAAAYQSIEIRRLDDVLVRSGISDQQLRRRICQDFFFESGHFLDAGSFRVDRNDPSVQTVSPFLCFEELRGGRRNRSITRKVYLPSDYFAFHEYVHGNVGDCFERERE